MRWYGVSFTINSMKTTKNDLKILAAETSSMFQTMDVVGLMYLLDIDLNGITLLNLIVAAGIGVEFCQHLMQAYATAVRVQTDTRPGPWSPWIF